MYPSFESILKNLEAGKMHTFPGGVHPDGKKSLSNTQMIATPSLPDLLVIPLRQHIGAEGASCVEVGDNVLKGQVLSHSTSPFSVPVHAPTSGEVIAIAPHVVAHPSGLTEMCISIRPDGLDTWCELTPISNFLDVSKSELIEIICQAGISGMGGAGFPTHIKTSTSKPVEFLVLNGVECEPYITSDDRLMREHAWQIRQGLDVLSHLIGPKAVVIAIEDNKPEAIEALTIACQDKKEYRVVTVETKYPAGGEKQLIQVLTGREVPRNGLPADVGVMMFNVGTCYAIADAILHGKPLIERVVTVTGEAVESPCNYKALIGTPVSHLLNEAKYQARKQKSPKVIMGGPMMGFTLSDATIPVVKTTNCLLVPAKKELVDDNAERPCIRCSACADACPVSLLPQQMFWHAKAKELEKAQDYDLFDCIECGACAYVCPSEIPLVHYYRQAKSEIRLQRDEKNKAEKAKQRFEARKERLEREKLEREAKHRKAKEARLAANKVKEQASSEQVNTSDSAAKDKVAAALARAKAKKAALQANSDTASNNSASQAGTDTNKVQAADDKKAQVAAAIARAKAKKQAQLNAATTSENDANNTNDVKHVSDTNSLSDANSVNDTNNASAEQDDKKAKVAAAIARAKAKKAAQAANKDGSDTTGVSNSKSTQNNELSNEQPSHQISEAEQKKARIAAAVAKAKAKKAQQLDESGPQRDQSKDEANSSMSDNMSTSSGNSAADEHSAETVQRNDEKKARIAAAVAKAKAKKAAQEALSTPDSSSDLTKSEQSLDDEMPNSTPEVEKATSLEKANGVEDEKKARIAAAVAKAKAKKAAQEAINQTTKPTDESLSSTLPDTHSERASTNQADEKKARIAAAIAKAKAKKAAAEKENES
ncbi:MAG: electron transporter RnfC [Alteromonas sp. Nap_26]|nr:MAG: electron transporter RnfC [Alteromonas sp. Nap_26]